MDASITRCSASARSGPERSNPSRMFSVSLTVEPRGVEDVSRELTARSSACSALHRGRRRHHRKSARRVQPDPIVLPEGGRSGRPVTDHHRIVFLLAVDGHVVQCHLARCCPGWSGPAQPRLSRPRRWRYHRLSGLGRRPESPPDWWWPRLHRCRAATLCASDVGAGGGHAPPVPTATLCASDAGGGPTLVGSGRRGATLGNGYSQHASHQRDSDRSGQLRYSSHALSTVVLPLAGDASRMPTKAVKSVQLVGWGWGSARASTAALRLPDMSRIAKLRRADEWGPRCVAGAWRARLIGCEP